MFFFVIVDVSALRKEIQSKKTKTVWKVYFFSVCCASIFHELCCV